MVPRRLQLCLFLVLIALTAMVDAATTTRKATTKKGTTKQGGTTKAGGTTKKPSGGSGGNAGSTIKGTTGDPNFGIVSQAARDQWMKIKDSCCRIIPNQYELVDPNYCARNFNPRSITCTGTDFCAVILPIDQNVKLDCKPMPAACANPSSAPCGSTSGGSCNETNPQCCTWAKCGECDKNPYYMKVQCCKACGTAGATVYDVDTFPTKVSCDGAGGTVAPGGISSVSTTKSSGSTASIGTTSAPAGRLLADDGELAIGEPGSMKEETGNELTPVEEKEAGEPVQPKDEEAPKNEEASSEGSDAEVAEQQDPEPGVESMSSSELSSEN